MKIANKTQYALKFMLNLATVFEERTMSVSEVAGIEGISEKFLESIVAQIKAKGLVKVKRGAKGGYYLAKSPSKINIKEILEAVEADFSSLEFENALRNTPVEIVIHKTFVEINASMARVLEGKTLEDLLNLLDSLESEQMFYI